MRQALLFGLLATLCTAAQADVCAGRVAAGIVTYDQARREGAGLLLNDCGRPVKVFLVVHARNQDGFVVARGAAEVEAPAEPRLSVFTVELPFVQSAIRTSGYSAKVVNAVALDRSAPTAQTAEPMRPGVGARPGTLPALDAAHR